MFGLNPVELLIIGVVAMATVVFPIVGLSVVIWLLLGSKKDRPAE